MSILPLQPARVSTLLRSDVALQSISSTQSQLLTVQNEISTGKQLNVTSDNPGSAAVVVQLQQTLQTRQSYSTNLNQAATQLGNVDSTLGGLTDLLQQAVSTASANAGTNASAQQRAGAATTVQTLYEQALTIANQQENGSYVFGGDNNTTPPFVEGNGGVQFVGSSNLLSNQVDDNSSITYQVDGSAVFGATSQAVAGAANLSPQITAGTRLVDLKGANGTSIDPGSIQLSNGTTTQTIDLSHADSVGDVISAINAAGVGTITAAIGAAGNITLSTGADNITVSEVAGGSTASDLGLLHPTGSGAGVPVVGAGVQPAVTALTPLAALRGGNGIDTAHGIIIKNGSVSATIKLTSPPLRSPATVEDLLNAINGAGVNVLARINAAGTGIDIVNPTQGTQMTISENGGTTAADLGVASFSAASTLTGLNGGKGVSTVPGPDIQVTRADGTSFSVDIDGAKTVQDVIDRFNVADTNSGAQPAKVVAALVASGNGITLTDNSGGAGTLTVSPVNGSGAAADLGLTGPGVKTAGNTLTGADPSAVGANGIFANLGKLRDALNNNDQQGILSAEASLQADQQRVIDIRGQAGSNAKEVATRQTQLTGENFATNTLMSSLTDVDMATAITQFQTLQTALQATLETTSKTLSLSLFNYLQ